MTNYFTNIKDKIKNSSLTQDEQDTLIVTLSYAAEADLENISTLFEHDDVWIEKLLENIQKKQTAFANKDTVAWKTILQEEVEELEQIEQ